VTPDGPPATFILRRNDEVIWDRDVDGAMLLCHTGRAEFFKLNDTGALIWELCDGRTIENTIAEMSARYPMADSEMIASMVRGYIPLLQEAGLLQDSNSRIPTD
jgi:hypothetical protein